MNRDSRRSLRISVLLALLLCCGLMGQNDCATALPILAGSTTGSTAAFTGNLVTSCGTLHKTIWYAYTSTCNGTATATLCSPGTASFDTILAAYDGTAGCSNLVFLACNDNACGTRSAVMFQVTIGRTYLIALGAAVSGVSGTFTLSLGCAPSVSNDDCTGAIPVSSGVTVGSNVGATNSMLAGMCASMGSDVWYVYTPTCSGVAEATFCQPGTASFDTVLAVFAAANPCPQALQIACNDDTCLLSSKVLFPVTAGSSYLLAIGGFAAAQGTFALSLACHPPAANDDCTGAAPLLLGANGPYSNQFATDGVAPTSGCQAGYGDLWFTYTAACPGLHRISTCGSGYDTIVSVRTGACGASSEVACNDNDPSGACGVGSVVDFAATAGTTYVVRVASGTPVRGSFSVTVSRPLHVAYSSPLGPGSVAYAVDGGVPNGLCFDGVTFTAGGFPNDPAFFGIALSSTELANEIAAGAPFLTSLDACGRFALPPVVLPALSGMTFFSVVVTSDATATLPIVASPPVSYTIP